MTSTLGRPGTADARDTPVVSLSAPTRRRPSWVVGGVLLVGLAALLGAYVFSAATDTLRVTVAATDLAPGDVIDAGDLRVVELGRTNQLRAILADQQSLIIGLTPEAPIPAGTLLNTGLFVAADDAIPAGQVVVGASFSSGEVPTPTLTTGDRIELLVVQPQTIAGPSATEAPTEAALVGQATVWAVTGEASTSASSNRVWVSLLVDRDLQTVVAQAAAEERLRLSLVPR